MPKPLWSLIGFAFVLAGCGSAQPAGPIPQGAGQVMQRQRYSGSWMKAGTSSQDLLYVGDGNKNVWVLTFPQGRLVGDLEGITQAWGLCSDTSGNVFVTEYSANEVLEYAHGGTSPINTLSAHAPFACSWDPSTGNLAVVERPDSIAIYANATGTAKTYADYSFMEFNYCAYDDKSNLFVTGEKSGPTGLAEFNGKGFTTISLPPSLNALANLQWDGKYIAIDDFFGSAGDGDIYRVKVSGSTGTVVGSTTLGGARFYSYWTWLQGGTFISPIFTGGHDDKSMDFWSYPSGGKPTKHMPRSDFRSKGPIRGITVSVAPSG